MHQSGKATHSRNQELFKHSAGEVYKLRVKEWMKNANDRNWNELFSAQAMDRNGNLFFVLMDPIAVVCWDSSLPYVIENIKIVIQNDATLQFASGVKVIKNLHGNEELWIITNRFQVRKFVWNTELKVNNFFLLNCRKFPLELQTQMKLISASSHAWSTNFWEETRGAMVNNSMQISLFHQLNRLKIRKMLEN
jgi:Major royal jelly protein